jgi:branched-chain amino acid transport system substrate-binding protein
MRRSLIAYLLAGLILVVQGWAQTVEATEPAPVLLGALYNLTGFQAELDVPSSRGARLAESEINRDGGVLGRQIRLALEDGESPAEVLRK